MFLRVISEILIAFYIRCYWSRVLPNGLELTRRAAAGWSLRRETNLKARGAADLRRDSPVGCSEWLGSDFDKLRIGPTGTHSSNSNLAAQTRTIAR